MDLTTFIPPTVLPASLAPGVGELAPALPFAEHLGTSPFVIVFLRHVGCPFAELTILDVCRAADDYPGLEFVVVTQANWGQSRAWSRQLGAVAPIEILADPDRTLYSAWGLGLSDWWHFAGARPLRACAELYRETGIRNRHPVGTRWQRGGAFAVGADGLVKYRHIDAHAGDQVDIDQAAASLRS